MPQKILNVTQLMRVLGASGRWKHHIGLHKSFNLVMQYRVFVQYVIWYMNYGLEESTTLLYISDYLSGFLDRVITVSCLWQHSYLALTWMRSSSWDTFSYKLNWNAVGNTQETCMEPHTPFRICFTVCASYIPPVIAVLCGCMTSSDLFIYLKCRSHADHIPVSSRLLFRSMSTGSV